MAMSPNSLQQTKEQNFQIYLVMKDFIINAGKVLINLPKAVAQQSFCSNREEITPLQIQIQPTKQPQPLSSCTETQASWQEAWEPLPLLHLGLCV